MAKTTLVIDTSRSKELANKDFAIMLRISQNRQQLRVPTGVKVKEAFWDKENECVITTTRKEKGDPEALAKNTSLELLTGECNKKILLNKELVARMSVHQLRDFLFEKKAKLDTNLFNWLQKLIDEKTENKQISRAGNLKAVKSKLQDYHKKPHLDMNTIDAKWLKEFSNWCAKTPVKWKKDSTMSLNSIDQYLVNVRQAFKLAIKSKAITNNPFLDYESETEEVEQCRLTFNDLRKIRDMKIPNQKKSAVPMERARDIYLLSVYLRGICPIDLFNLTDANLRDGRIEWRRQKTDEKCSVKLEPEMVELIEKYRGDQHLLFFADPKPTEGKKGVMYNLANRYSSIDTFSHAINDGLKLIQKQLGIIPWTSFNFYSARHTVSTLIVTKAVGGSIQDSQIALGHKPEGFKTTLIYTEFEKIRADEIHRKFLDVLAMPLDSEAKVINLSVKPQKIDPPVEDILDIKDAI